MIPTFSGCVPKALLARAGGVAALSGRISTLSVFQNTKSHSPTARATGLLGRRPSLDRVHDSALLVDDYGDRKMTDDKSRQE